MVITEEASEWLIVPSKVPRNLTDQLVSLREVLYTTMGTTDTVLAFGTTPDQGLLRESRRIASEAD